MGAASWDELQRLFKEALARPAGERAAFLQASCPEAEARRQVEELLAAHAAGESYMEAPLAGMKPGDERAGEPPRVEGFRILGEIGRGGMGVVYEAEQAQPRRKVALKVMRSPSFSAALQRRFEHEAHLLARLQHPGIAQIYEAGTAPAHGAAGGSFPYFAMELVRGRTLVEHAVAAGLDVRARVELLARVADAVQHAHGKGVIHRDLKPSNVLVTAAGQPVVLDFGVGRAMDRDVQLTTLHTDVGQLLGTLPYMSPEQATGESDDLDTRSDVYALGVVGYELLAGRLPYDVGGIPLLEALRIIREREPRRLSEADRTLRGDVETILARALEKDRERRYQSASDFAADLRRYLAYEPIVARPASRTYQLARFARRNRALVGAVTGLAVVLAVSSLTSTALGLKRSRALADAEAAGELAVERRLELEQVSGELGRALARANAARAEAERQSAIADSVRTFLEDDVLAQGDPTVNTDRGLTIAEALDNASRRIEGRFSDAPYVNVSIRRTIARSYQNLRRPAEARAHLERTLELVCELYGEDSDEARAERRRRASLESSEGRPAAAAAQLEEHEARGAKGHPE